MNKFQGNKAQRAASTIAAVAVLVAGLLASTASNASSAAFDNRMSHVIKHVMADPSYKKIPLDSTNDREWFDDQSEALFAKKITKEQYVADGVKHYPGYDASFVELADLLTAP